MVVKLLAIALTTTTVAFPSDPTLFERRLSEKSHLLNAQGCDEMDVRAAYQLELSYGMQNPCASDEDLEGAQSSHL